MVEGVACEYIIELEQGENIYYLAESVMNYEEYPKDGFDFRIRKDSDLGTRFVAGEAIVYIYVGTPTSDMTLRDSWNITIQEITQ